MSFKRYRLNNRVIDDLKKRSSIGIVFYIILAYIVTHTGDYYLRNQLFSKAFLFSISVICLFRFIHVFLFEEIRAYHEKLNTFIFIISVITTSLIWGAGFAMFMVQEGEYGAKLLMAICTTGLCSGGIVAFIPERRLSICFNILMTFPGFMMMIIKGANIPLAIMLILYSGYMILLTFRGNDEYWDALENEVMLKEKTREFEILSNTDVLTGLYNRRFFNQVMEAEWKRSCRQQHILTIAICDIDNFKSINDTYGHLSGDEYLKYTADILRKMFKRDTDVVARYGGEEFVILLPGVDGDMAYQMAESVRNMIENLSVEICGNAVSSTVSFGIDSCIPVYNNDSINTLVNNADQALYNAKKQGRNRVVLFNNNK